MKNIPKLSEIFGNILCEERRKANISQEKLAEEIDATNVFISLLENGQRQPSLNATILIARALGISASDFVGKVCRLLQDNR